jgi:hypothetical protein
MPAKKKEARFSDAPLTRFAKIGFNIVGGAAAAVTAVATIYGSIFSPKQDLLEFLGFALATFSVLTFGLTAFVALRRNKREARRSETEVLHPAFSYEDRRAALTRMLPLGIVFALCATVMFTIDHLLTPKILSISLSDMDDEVLVIKGSGFGDDASKVWIRFSESSTEEQVARRDDTNGIEVVVPENFTKGTISIRRGPRVSESVSFTFPGVIYDTAVVRLIQEGEDPVAQIMSQVETYPGFPYYSDVSDKPTQWPPRVFKDRADFQEKILQLLSGDALRETTNWESQNPPSLTIIGGDSDDMKLQIEQSYARLRMLLTDNHDDFDHVGTIVGPHASEALRKLEIARRGLVTDLPNRVLILRVRNRSPMNADDFTVELNVGGEVYDVTVNEEGEKARSLQWSPDRIDIDIPHLRPGNTTDIQVWYAYLPISERTFPDAADVEWEKTQGVVIDNLGISNGQIRRSKGLLIDLQPYYEYPVDPVKGSPTFGTLPVSQNKTNQANEQDQSRTTNPSDQNPNPGADRTNSIPNETVSTNVQVSPIMPTTEALLVHAEITESFEKQNDAREAQLIVGKALKDFIKGLSDLTGNANGFWIFQRNIPTKCEYSNFTGSYNVSGDLLGILRVDHPVSWDSIPGSDVLKRAGDVELEQVAWSQSKYQSVLQFFSDPRDTRQDSKRVLTKALPVDEIFDLKKARNGQPNVIAPEFAELLRFTRERLASFYHAPFTLDDIKESEEPFYLVVREPPVNENFYFPSNWMAEAEKTNPRSINDKILCSKLETLFDYGEDSRELTAQEFISIFGSK